MRQIQRSVETWGGAWDTEHYAKVIPAAPGGQRGAEMTLKFTANDKVNAELIGLTQTAKSVNNNKVIYINKTLENRSISSKDAITTKEGLSDEGVHIDRLEQKNNPVYGSMNLLLTTADITESVPPGGHPRLIPANTYVQITQEALGVSKGKLKVIKGPLSGTTIDFIAADLGNMKKAGNVEDTPMDNNTSGPPTNIATNATYQLGYHYMNGKILNQADAKLRDRPSQIGVDKNSSTMFEVAAIGLKGVQAGTYFGSVRWGWSTDATGNHNLLPLQVSSNQVPSSSFLKAAQLWNAGKTKDAADMVQLPIVDVKVTTAPIEMLNNKAIIENPQPRITGPKNQGAEIASVSRIIPTGTRVQIQTIGIGAIGGIKKDTTVKIIDGPLTGTVAQIDIKDLTKLTPERP
jgi:hypothetical protein